MRECPKCGESKKKSQYHKNKLNKNGLACYCKDCISKDRKDYRDRNREKIVKKAKKHYQKNKGRILREAREKRAKEVKRETNTYLLECEGFLKIGVSNNVKGRLATIRTGNPFEVKLIAVSDQNIESMMHLKFEHLRARGEWFHGCDAIIEEFIKWS
jgi:hypothetical protein